MELAERGARIPREIPQGVIKVEENVAVAAQWMKLQAMLNTTDQIITADNMVGNVRLSCRKYFAASTAAIGIDSKGSANAASPLIP